MSDLDRVISAMIRGRTVSAPTTGVWVTPHSGRSCDVGAAMIGEVGLQDSRPGGLWANPRHLFPEIYACTETRCPLCKLLHCSIAGLVMHLNDDHRDWTTADTVDHLKRLPDRPQ